MNHQIPAIRFHSSAFSRRWCWRLARARPWLTFTAVPSITHKMQAVAQHGWLTVAQLLLVHLLLVTGMFPELTWPERLAQYGKIMAGLVRPEVLFWVLPELLLTATYLLGGLGLTWWLSGVMLRLSRRALWVHESLPPYLLLLLLVWAGLSWALARGVDFPLRPWHPLMLLFISVALAWGGAARAALVTGAARQEALRADFTRTARAMGLPEQTVSRQAGRVALPRRAWSVAGEAVGLSLSLIIMEGLLDFPGLGREGTVALQAVLGGHFVRETISVAFQESLLPLQIIGVSLLFLLLLTFLASLLLSVLARRLDPRPRAGQEET